jgi:ATP-dependent Lon protease
VRWIDKVLELALERVPTPLPDVDPSIDATGNAVVRAVEATRSVIEPQSVESIKH